MLRVRTESGDHLFEAGREATVGRTSRVEPVDIALGDDTRLHRRMGVIRVHPDGWTLANTGTWLQFDVRDVDGTGTDRVGPGDERRIPWRRARVHVSVGDRDLGFTAEVDGDRPSAPSAAPERPAPVTGEATVPAFSIDRSSGYFRALVALCATRIDPGRAGEPATVAEIAALLNRAVGDGVRVTPKAVERRLDYCAQILGLKSRALDDPGGLPEARNLRSALADLALSTGTVTDREARALFG